MSAPAAGAWTMLMLFVLDLATGEVGFLGQRDARAIAVVMQAAHARAVRQQLVILVVLLVVGLLFGAFGMLVGRAWDLALRRAPPKLVALRGVIAAIAGHAFFLVRSVIEYPQLYALHFYLAGGVRRALMVFFTDHVSLRALDTFAFGVVALLFVAPLLLRRREAIAWVRAHARRVGGVAVVGLLVVGVVAWQRHRRVVRAPYVPGRTRPNVLVVAIDSLRADRVFAPDAAQRFPNLARLAARGVRFHQAYVSQARTLPSFVTLLTGRFPQHHGIRHEFPTAEARRDIGPSITSVARDAGWHTAAVSDFSGEIFARMPFGIDDVDVAHFNLYTIVEGSILNAHVNVLPYAASEIGESIFPAMRAMAEYADPETLADRAISAMEKSPEKPFFLVLFYSGTHTPYVAPSPWYRAFTDPSYAGPFRYLKEPLPLVPSLPRVDAKQVQALYDGALAAIDASLSRVLQRLEEDGAANDTIIVLLGDHGENLFDVPGRGLGHGDHLLGDLANHIPLVVVDPVHAPPPHDVNGIVRDVDLAPTLADLLGVPAAPSDGVDLSPLLRAARDELDLDAYEETGLWFIQNGPGFSRSERLPYPDVWHASDVEPDGEIFLQSKWEEPVVVSKHRAVRTPKWKLLYQPTLAGPRWRLFDVVADPDERDDVLPAHLDEAAPLRAKLEAWITSDGRTQLRLAAPTSAP